MNSIADIDRRPTESSNIVAPAAVREIGSITATGKHSIKLFIRQPFTESNQQEQAIIAEVLQLIETVNGAPYTFNYLTGRQAESATTFKKSFELGTGLPFTPQHFRDHRLQLLSEADAVINIRVGMSESSAFELGYHIFKGRCTPLLFLVWKHAPIKTTLLRDLENLCDVTYLEFEHAEDLRPGIQRFFAEKVLGQGEGFTYSRGGSKETGSSRDPQPC